MHHCVIVASESGRASYSQPTPFAIVRCRPLYQPPASASGGRALWKASACRNQTGAARPSMVADGAGGVGHARIHSCMRRSNTRIFGSEASATTCATCAPQRFGRSIRCAILVMRARRSSHSSQGMRALAMNGWWMLQRLRTSRTHPLAASGGEYEARLMTARS